MMEFGGPLLDLVAIPKYTLKQLLTLPDTAIKLYLYGLTQEGTEIEALQEVFALSRTELIEALEQLEEKGLIHASYAESLSITYLLPQPKEAKEDGTEALYRDGEFNSIVQELFSDRMLSYEDYRAIYELIDVYGLPKQVALILLEYCIENNNKGNRVSFNYIKKTGRSWAKEEINTIARAEEKLQGRAQESSGAAEILSMLNIRRKPTAPEQELYAKWQEEWGFTQAAIKAATVATTGARNPSLRYLDGVLKNLRNEGIRSSEEVKQHFAAREAYDEVIKEILHMLSYPSLSVSSEQRKYYENWISMGFSKREILFAATLAASNRATKISYMDTLLKDWKRQALFTLPEIEAYVEKEQALQACTRKMLEAAGVKKRIAKADKALYQKFSVEYGFSEEIILYAASLAHGYNAPLRFMERVLQRWAEADVKTLAAAQAENQTFQAATGRKNNGSLSDIQERSYTTEELETLVEDPLAAYMEKNKEDQNDANKPE
ncbi:MAG: DnaD domain protein [Christensenellaceae bacterium]|jgi:DNA replication protein DnaD